MSDAPQITSEQMRQVLDGIKAGHGDLSISIKAGVPEPQVARLRTAAKKSTPRKSR